MKNKLIIILIILFQFLFINQIFSEEIQFNAKEIEIIDEGNETIAKNGSVFIEKDKISVDGAMIKYIKNKSLLIVNEGKIKRIEDNLEITSEIIEYSVDQSDLYLKNNVKINDFTNNLKISTNEINYNLEKQKIESSSKSEIKDNFDNIYQVSQFEYDIKNKIVKLRDLEILDVSKNIFKIDQAFLDLEKKELIAKDVGLNFKIFNESENEPRLKGRSLISNNENTIVKKGTFTFCKKREKCPPWEMSAEEIKHDKKKKTIYYKNASLKIYDKKVFYFPKFFHPDPTVERQSGFLIPKIQDNSTTGLSLNLPYFIALAENKDITLSPRFFAEDKLLIQSEFRQKNKNSNHQIDLSQYVSNKENTKGHFFYDFNKDYKNDIFDEIEFNIQLEQVSDETYLKAYKIESPIINNTSNLTNSVNINFVNENASLNTNLDIYEDLSKEDSDKYEYVPNFSLSKIINENNALYSKGYYKNYDTNITEKVLINNFEFESNPRYLDNGIVNNNKILVKNINSNATNSKNFKNKSSFNLTPSFQSNYSLPLIKETIKSNNTLTPRVSLRLSTPYTKDVRKTDRKISYDNIYDLNRLGIDEANEGGISLTYGYEYSIVEKSSSEENLKFGFANNLRLEENKDLPLNSNLGDKVSDFVGMFEYKPNKNLKFDYDFSYKNNLNDLNYELYGFEFYLKNLTTKFEYQNENNSSLKTSYLKNETRFNFNKKNSLIFETRENKEKSFTEFYNLIYQYEIDCLTAAIEYNKEYYNDQDLKPSENLFFKLSIIPFGGFNTPSLK
ncbi:hypothetical protein [Candidatus Pelagibacter sp.]|uniref:hypothetical protein n=1 Tax=Candidatus Pelagibacter sp. TaxID=2024849 RepID=UPI003F845C62